MVSAIQAGVMLRWEVTSTQGQRTACSQVSLCICGHVPGFCEALVEEFWSLVILILRNLGKDASGAQGCLLSWMHLVYWLMP